MAATALNLAIVLCLLSTASSEGQIRSLHIKRSESGSLVVNKTVNENGVSNLSESIDQFSVSLLVSTVLQNSDQNIIVSPFSVWTLLTILSEGAYGNTYSEIVNTLHHLKDRNEMRNAYSAVEQAINGDVAGIKLEVDNEIFVKHDLQISSNYINLVKSLYKSKISTVNFQNPATLTYMNQIISNATHGKITDAFKEGDLQSASLLLSNTIFFKGGWTFPFDKVSTKEESFFDDNNRVIGKVNMMFKSGPFAHKFFKEIESDIVEVPYGEVNCDDFYDIMAECIGKKSFNSRKPKFSMVLVVPYGASLDEVLTKLSRVSLTRLFNIMDTDPLKNTDQLELYMPRFKVYSDLSMKSILTGMGIIQAFDEGSANFTGIAPNNQLFVSKITHKAIIEVTEEGTVASAATVGILVDRITPGKVKLEKPFMFMIVEKSTNTIVFSGTYRKPDLY